MAGSGHGAKIDRNGLEILERSACLDLLGTAPLGRLAYLSGAVPKVIPVNFQLEDGRLRFRLGTGGALAAIEAGRFVTFEADEIDPDTGSGWSVCVLGIATEICERPDVEPGPPVRSWLRGTRGRTLGLPTDQIEGRRLRPTAG